jgi:hypothetical protein
MKKQELKASTADPCLFVHQRSGKKLIVTIYVDDGLVVGSDQSEIVMPSSISCAIISRL